MRMLLLMMMIVMMMLLPVLVHRWHPIVDSSSLWPMDHQTAVAFEQVAAAVSPSPSGPLLVGPYHTYQTLLRLHACMLTI